METYDEMKDDPKRTEFLKDFQDELLRQEELEKKQAERKKVWNFQKRKRPIEEEEESSSSEEEDDDDQDADPKDLPNDLNLEDVELIEDEFNSI